jgi:hypothetical protein
VFSLLNFIAAALSARVRALFSGFQLFWLLLLLLLLECHRVGSLFEFQLSGGVSLGIFCLAAILDPSSDRLIRKKKKKKSTGRSSSRRNGSQSR